MTNSVERHFSKAARAYEQEAALQREIAAETAALLPAENIRSILELGCGSGFLTGHIAGRCPEAAITAVDLSPAMIDLARQSIAPGRIEFLSGDAKSIQFPHRAFDIVVSSSALQWMRPLGDIFASMRETLAENGRLVFSLFTEGTLRELHETRAKIVPAKSANTTRLPTVASVEEALRAAGFHVEKSRVEQTKVEYASARSFVESIRRLGFTAVTEPDYVALSRREIGTLLSFYEEAFRNGSRTFATFVTAYFVARSDGSPSRAAATAIN